MIRDATETTPDALVRSGGSVYWKIKSTDGRIWIGSYTDTGEVHIQFRSVNAIVDGKALSEAIGRESLTIERGLGSAEDLIAIRLKDWVNEWEKTKQSKIAPAPNNVMPPLGNIVEGIVGVRRQIDALADPGGVTDSSIGSLSRAQGIVNDQGWRALNAIPKRLEKPTEVLDDLIKEQKSPTIRFVLGGVKGLAGAVEGTVELAVIVVTEPGKLVEIADKFANDGEFRQKFADAIYEKIASGKAEDIGELVVEIPLAVAGGVGAVKTATTVIKYSIKVSAKAAAVIRAGGAEAKKLIRELVEDAAKTAPKTPPEAPPAGGAAPKPPPEVPPAGDAGPKTPPEVPEASAAPKTGEAPTPPAKPFEGLPEPPKASGSSLPTPPAKPFERLPEPPKGTTTPLEVPGTAPKIEPGAKLGSGGNKDVFVVKGDESKAVGILRAGKPAASIEEEIALIKELEAQGLPTVKVYGVVEVEGRPAIVMDRYAQGSKDVVKLQDGKVRIVGDSTLLNEKSVADLQKIRDIMVCTFPDLV